MKRFRNFENISHKENDFIQIEYGCVYKSSSKTVYLGGRIESIQDFRKEYRKLRRMLKEKNFLRGIFKNLLKRGLN